MKKKSIIRKYHFTDAELIIKVKEKIAFMQRDALAFETFGITATNSAALKNAIEAFTALETDIEIKGSQTGITVAKKAKANELIEAIKTVMTIASMKFKKDSLQYFHFGTSDITHQKEADLYITARLVIRMSQRYLPELTAHGLTMAHIDNISILNEAYSELLTDQHIARAERTIYREKRITVGNNIYQTLLKYTAIGLAHWETRNAAKYNDYVLYEDKSRKLRIA